MNALGPLAKGLAFLMGKQPEEERHPRGFLGLEWSDQVEAGQTPRSGPSACSTARPPPAAGLQPGDRILRINGSTDRRPRRRPAPPWPTSGRAIPSPWSSAAARVPMPAS